ATRRSRRPCFLPPMGLLVIRSSLRYAVQPEAVQKYGTDRHCLGRRPEPRLAPPRRRRGGSPLPMRQMPPKASSTPSPPRSVSGRNRAPTYGSAVRTLFQTLVDQCLG